MKTLTAWLLLGLLLPLPASAANDRTTGPSRRLQFAVARAEPKRSDKEKEHRFSAVVFADKALKRVVYLTELGTLAVGTAGKGAKPDGVLRHLYTFRVRVRPPGETDFTRKLLLFNIAVYHDSCTDLLVLVSETGSIAVSPGERPGKIEKVKSPEWWAGLELRTRKAGHQEFNKDTPQFSLEVYRDAHTGRLLYVTNTGQIAVVDADIVKPKRTREPLWWCEFEVKARLPKRNDPGKFTTHPFGGELYQDVNISTLFYLSETGSIATVPLGKQARPQRPRPAQRKHGHSFAVEKKAFAVEVYEDRNADCLLFVSGSGAIAVVSR